MDTKEYTIKAMGMEFFLRINYTSITKESSKSYWKCVGNICTADKFSIDYLPYNTIRPLCHIIGQSSRNISRF